ncbi:lipoate--protein ligase family protein [Rhodopirellula sp. JC740]|uniref:Lipoate--protein ligase family protein n=1 Tax=Rhodopirellula halodulae TaxID=2894198 RepID=A0ABS8NE77_9BACT|nr:lipoate--protein ligase family protein [Rhodopirellula sp. JC740]MCC9641227.1 lipoate--protein ligase family protein [Rhodopirellula sp. JC740]
MQLLTFDQAGDRPRISGPTENANQAASDLLAKRQLARDEAMLQWADQVVAEDSDTGLETETLRVWSFERPTVVLGRSSKIDEEVNRSWCQQNEVPVLRRCTGGASVVGGPGCWMYSVVLRLLDETSIRKVDVAHDYVMTRVLAAVRKQLPEAERQGICDLTYQNRKFSGNSLRVARHHLLYHGTLLMGADLDLIQTCLEYAPRQPEYRAKRDHRDFVGNIELDIGRWTQDLAQQFAANTRGDRSVEHSVETVANELLQTRYSDPQWHTRR